MSKQREIVWVSNCISDTRLVKYFISDFFQIDANKAAKNMNQNEAGFPISKEYFPENHFAEYKDKKYKKLPEIFSAGGFWMVSEACADVLRQFDLGDGALYPTQLFQNNRTTRVEGAYYCINFGNQKRAFAPEHSPEAMKPYPNQDLWKLPFVLKDRDIVVSKVALKGPDLWIDPFLRGALFLSDPLVQALKAAKLTRPFGPRKCKVLSEN
ncbi:imm11 family protein [Cochlodiniinecator piscidefendens]|uniref:imm11 family protein n=1 Tax=Cochlodiniinecator piscidefendens TaxID=2715756 RepID=UPI00140E37A3|nr:DUF1629 domain-containing protein [Cochlodiniinecator piscidefendens]